eukprot:g24640.t1
MSSIPIQLQVGTDIAVAICFFIIPLINLSPALKAMLWGGVKCSGPFGLCVPLLLLLLCFLSGLYHLVHALLLQTYTATKELTLLVLTFLLLFNAFAAAICLLHYVPRRLMEYLQLQARLVEARALLSSGSKQSTNTSFGEIVPTLDFSLTCTFSTVQIVRLAEDVLDLARKNERRIVEVGEEEFELHTILRQLANYWRRFVRRKVKLDLDISPTLPALVVGDSTLLCQLLHLLLENATKMTSKGAIHVEVSTNSQPESPQLVNKVFEHLASGSANDPYFLLHVRITDTGQELPRHRRITHRCQKNKFSPASPWNISCPQVQREGEICLSIAQSVTEAMGGTMRSKRLNGGGGTRVSLSLPLKAHKQKANNSSSVSRRNSIDSSPRSEGANLSPGATHLAHTMLRRSSLPSGRLPRRSSSPRVAPAPGAGKQQAQQNGRPSNINANSNLTNISNLNSNLNNFLWSRRGLAKSGSNPENKTHSPRSNPENKTHSPPHSPRPMARAVNQSEKPVSTVSAGANKNANLRRASSPHLHLQARTVQRLPAASISEVVLPKLALDVDSGDSLNGLTIATSTPPHSTPREAAYGYSPASPRFEVEDLPEMRERARGSEVQYTPDNTYISSQVSSEDGHDAQQSTPTSRRKLKPQDLQYHIQFASQHPVPEQPFPPMSTRHSLSMATEHSFANSMSHGYLSDVYAGEDNNDDSFPINQLQPTNPTSNPSYHSPHNTPHNNPSAPTGEKKYIPARLLAAADEFASHIRRYAEQTALEGDCDPNYPRRYLDFEEHLYLVSEPVGDPDTSGMHVLGNLRIAHLRLESDARPSVDQALGPELPLLAPDPVLPSCPSPRGPVVLFVFSLNSPLAGTCFPFMMILLTLQLLQAEAAAVLMGVVELAGGERWQSQTC